LSRFVQFVELDLSRFAGRRPVEIFGHTHFPAITKAPYLLTISPHAFYWFALETEVAPLDGAPAERSELARLTIPPGSLQVVRGRIRRNLEHVLLRELPRRGWFGQRAKPVDTLQISDSIPLGRSSDRQRLRLLVLRVDPLENDAESYLLPLRSEWGQDAERVTEAQPGAALAQLQRSKSKETGVLCEASHDPDLADSFLDIMLRRRRLKVPGGHLAGWSTAEMAEINGSVGERLTAVPRTATGDNSFVFADKWIFKLFRRVESGVNADLEMSRFLVRPEVDFKHIVPAVGAVEYRRDDGDIFTLGVLHDYVPNTVTNWADSSNM
jgi:maltose alpha-D-glucosyltransferase/alpha-amylase